MSNKCFDLILPGWMTAPLGLPDSAAKLDGFTTAECIWRVGDRIACEPVNYESSVRDRLGCRHLSGDVSVCADLMYFEPGMRDVLVSPLPIGFTLPERLRARMEEAVNAVIQDEDGVFALSAHGGGVLTLPKAPPLADFPPSRVWGQGIGGTVKKLDDDSSGYWARLFTELQMILHRLDMDAGEGEIGVPNGFWFWKGLGHFSLAESGYSTVCSTDASVRLLDENIKPWTTGCELMGGAGRSLLIWHKLLICDTQDGEPDWRERLQELDSEVLEPLYRAVMDKQIDELRILTGTGTDFRLRRNHRWRFWRWRRTLVDLFGNRV